MIAALLLGRKGSKGFPNKNVAALLGHPISFYPMKAALNCKDVDRTYLSTDDERLQALARTLGAEIIIRPPELCTDAALGEHAYVHGYREICGRLGREPEMMALLFCNAPAVTPKLISQGVKALRDNPEYDSAVTVSKYNMWSPLRAKKIGSDGLLQPFVSPSGFGGDPRALTCDRDSQGDVWFPDMGLSLVRPRCLDNLESGMPPQKWMGRKIFPLKQAAGLDVDFEWQMPQAEAWLKMALGAGDIDYV